MILHWDEIGGGGWWVFKLPADDPFQPAFAVHDRWYDEFLAGTATKTLKQVDREFLRNMLRIAARIFWETKDVADLARHTRRAWVFYSLARAWAVVIRPSLNDFKPKKRYRGDYV